MRVDAISDSGVFQPHVDCAPADVYAYYRRFREAADVARGGPSWLGGDDGLVLLRHADVMAALKDRRLGRDVSKLIGNDRAARDDASRETPPGITFGRVADNWMLFNDPPVHTRMRSAANMAFTPKAIARREQRIRDLAGSLADAMEGGEHQNTDLIRTFAYPLPVLVIADILGVPESDRDRFRDWAGVIAAAIDLPAEGLQAFAARADETTRTLDEYFRWIVMQRRAEPRDDLVSSLVHAADGERAMTNDELVANCILLLVAGHETTVNLIGNGMNALLRNREQWETLVADPSLAGKATEELLRFDAPVQLTTRVAMESVTYGGVTVRPGTDVSTIIGSANRDERAFADPDRLDIRRDVGRIMSFGMGIHFCLGAPLARLEGAIAFETLARRFPGMEIGSDIEQWRDGLVLRGLAELPVRLAGMQA